MNVLITGSTGFIGQALIQFLVRENVNVIAASRSVNQSLKSSVRQVRVDNLSPDTDWSQAVENVDTVIHLAARAHIINDQGKDSLSGFRQTNTAGTTNLARQAARFGVKRFIFISSIGVNGNQTTGTPFTADDVPSPVEPYAVSKHEAELGLHQVAADTGLEIVVIRPPLVYGANAPGNFGRLLKSIAYGAPLPLGAVHNRRSFVSVDNLVDLISRCVSHPSAANQTFLVSDGEDLSTTSLLKRLGSSMNRPVRLLPVPQRLLKVCLLLIGKKSTAHSLCSSLQVDISKTSDMLDWAPPFSVDEALEKTAQVYVTTKQ